MSSQSPYLKFLHQSYHTQFAYKKANKYKKHIHLNQMDVFSYYFSTYDKVHYY